MSADLRLEFEPTNFCDGVYWGIDDGKKRKADGLAVRLTGFCSEACDFCIAAEDMKHKRPMDVPKMLEGIRKTEARSMQVLGGEPLLFLDKCIELVEGCVDDMDYIFFTTALPKTVEVQWDKFVRLTSNLNNLTVSIQSTDWRVNNELMNSKNRFDRIALLERVSHHLGDKLIVHLNLVQGGVDTELKLWNTLDDLSEMGVSRVRINELQGAPTQYVSFEEISGIDMKSPYANGCKTPMKLYPGMETLVKRSCFLVEESLTATSEDTAKLLDKEARPEVYAWQPSTVMYENGELQEYWVEAREESKAIGKPVSLGMPAMRKVP